MKGKANIYTYMYYHICKCFFLTFSNICFSGEIPPKRTTEVNTCVFTIYAGSF